MTSFFSLIFFSFWICGLILYYTVFLRGQWIFLVLASLFFYIYSIKRIPFHLMVVFLVTFFVGILIDKCNEKILIQRICRGCVVFCILFLICCRETNIFGILGASYYTLKAISYVLDVKNETTCAEKNCFRYLLYLIYFPAILQGPINRYEEFRNSIEKKHCFNYVCFTHGLQRFLWGLFKKLVVCSRFQEVTDLVFSNFEKKDGACVIIGCVSCVFWYYLDFSGYMDIVLGISESFCIDLPENFRQPLFSKSVAEFWRRWHITLGLWVKDYVLMPFQQSKCARKIRKSFSKQNRQVSITVTFIIGTFLVWLFTALWHGFSIRFLLWGVYYFLIICLSYIIENHRKRSKKKSKIHVAFLSVRTFLFVMIACIILEIDHLKDLCGIVKKVLSVRLDNFRISSWSKGIGLDNKNLLIVGVGIILIMCVSCLKESKKDVHKVFDSIPLVFRWAILYGLIFAIMLFGKYGANVDVSDFMYMQF